MTHNTSVTQSDGYVLRPALIARLEQQRDLALKDAQTADPYSKKQLLRYAEAMNQQINTIKTARTDYR